MSRAIMSRGDDTYMATRIPHHLQPPSPQLPFKRLQMPSSADHKALGRGALEGAGFGFLSAPQPYLESQWPRTMGLSETPNTI